MALGLPLRNQDELNHFLQELYAPASTNYHRYLTPEQFVERFGPTEADYQKLMAFAKANNFAITATHPNRTLLDVKGTVADIEKACRVNLRLYKHPTEARSFYAPDNEPSLDLDIPMLAISGLDNYLIPHPMDLRPAPANKTPNATATGSGPTNAYIGNDFRAAYAPGVSLTGTGQSVGLLEFDGYYTNDIVSYERLAGLPNVTLTNVLLDGFDGITGATNFEVPLDIEMAISMAPGLSAVIVYETSANNSGNDILNRMATDNVAKQLSSSWIFSIDASTPQIFSAVCGPGPVLLQRVGGQRGIYWSQPFAGRSNKHHLCGRDHSDNRRSRRGMGLRNCLEWVQHGRREWGQQRWHQHLLLDSKLAAGHQHELKPGIDNQTEHS